MALKLILLFELLLSAVDRILRFIFLIYFLSLFFLSFVEQSLSSGFWCRSWSGLEIYIFVWFWICDFLECCENLEGSVDIAMVTVLIMNCNDWLSTILEMHLGFVFLWFHFHNWWTYWLIENHLLYHIKELKRIEWRQWSVCNCKLRLYALDITFVVSKSSIWGKSVYNILQVCSVREYNSSDWCKQPWWRSCLQSWWKSLLQWSSGRPAAASLSLKSVPGFDKTSVNNSQSNCLDAFC